MFRAKNSEITFVRSSRESAAFTSCFDGDFQHPEDTLFREGLRRRQLRVANNMLPSPTLFPYFVTRSLHSAFSSWTQASFILRLFSTLYYLMQRYRSNINFAPPLPPPPPAAGSRYRSLMRTHITIVMNNDNNSKVLQSGRVQYIMDTVSEILIEN